MINESRRKRSRERVRVSGVRGGARISRAKDASFGESLRGYFLEKVGNCESAVGRKGLTPEARRRALEAAVASYRNAVELWRQYGAQISPGVIDEGRAELVERRLRRIQ